MRRLLKAMWYWIKATQLLRKAVHSSEAGPTGLLNAWPGDQLALSLGRGDFKAVKILAEAGAYIDARDSSG